MKFSSASKLAFTLALICVTRIASADDAAKTQSRQHFRQGVALFDERRFGDALVQFEQSYALFPVYSTLYNVGQVHVALGHPVQAVEAFEKFLVQGGSSVAAEQRTRVETELLAQRERVGDIKVAVSPDGADIRVDGDSIGRSPLNSSVKVAAGHHRVEAMLDGYRTERSEIDVSGQGHVELKLQLQPLAVPVPTPVTPPAEPAAAKPTLAPSTTVMVVPTAAPVVAPPAALNSGSSASGTVQRVFGYTLAAAGLIGAGVGIAWAVDGQSKHNDALAQLSNGDRAGAELTESAATKEKTKGYVVIGAGGAVMLTGAILLIASPSGNSGNSRLNWSPWIGTSTAGASVRGIW